VWDFPKKKAPALRRRLAALPPDVRTFRIRGQQDLAACIEAFAAEYGGQCA
jgi:hypothetical protein